MSADNEYSEIQKNKKGTKTLVQNKTKNPFETFQNPFTRGGLTPEEEKFLFQIFQNASSVFEWGAGTSTFLAHHAGVQRHVSVDSSAEWVGKVQEIMQNRTSSEINGTKTPNPYSVTHGTNGTLPNWRIQHVNVGKVGGYGKPVDNSSKSSWPLYSQAVIGESERFDVYYVDGRFRVACVLQALLHAAKTAASESEADNSDSLIAIHDFQRKPYQSVLEFVDQIDRKGNLAVLRRKRNITNFSVMEAAVMEAWDKYKWIMDRRLVHLYDILMSDNKSTL